MLEIERSIKFCCEKQKIEEESEVSVTFVTNERIQEINQEYQG